jgi:hypothetical protein
MGFSYNVNVLNQKGSPAIYTDTFANRPNFGFAGRLFISNDTAAIYEDTGTAWVLIANVSSGAGTLQQVTTNGNTSNVGISVTAGGVSTNSLTDTALTLGSVPFTGAGGLISQDNANFFWDDTNNRLGINTNTPGNSLDVHTSGTNPILALNNTAGNQSAISFLNTSVAKWRIGNTSTNTFDIYNFVLSSIALQIKANNNAVFISSVQADDFILQPPGYSLLASLSRDLTGSGYGVLTLRNNANGTIQPSSLTVDRTYTLPDATGTLALTSNLTAYLPLAGGTMTGTLNGTIANFSGAVDFFNASVNIGELACDANDFYVGGQTGKGLKLCSNNLGNPHLFITVSGKVLIGSLIDDTVNKLQVTGSIQSTTKLVSGTSTTTRTQVEPQNLYQYVNNFYIYGLYNESNDLAIDSAFGGSIIFRAQNQGTSSVPGTAPIRLTVGSGGVITITNLAGTGSRAVLADASGNLSAPVSDISVKQNIEPLKYGLETIMKLNAVQFEFIEGFKNYGEGLQIGAIAQEIEQIIPEAVFTTPSTGLKGIDYNQFNGIYIKAFQDQQKIIESLIQRIELLENK